MEIPDRYCAPFHESSNRPHLLLGCDPAGLAIAFILCVIVAYSFLTWWGFLSAMLLFFSLRMLLREMAKEDPQMLRLYYEAQRYNQGFWTAGGRTK